jgi:NAD(P)-dependent dehydrogenase (short-subunit alcohol dehydrogenase family)
MSGKVCVVTGATSGIGKATATALARQGAQVVLVGRDRGRSEAAAAELAKVASSPPQAEIADLSSMAQVRALADRLNAMDRVDVLINNAGFVAGRRGTTDDGFEEVFAVNHLAPFLLTNLLLDRRKQSAPARVITTSSDAHKGNRIPFDDLGAERSYGKLGFERYGQTKLANILFTAELAKRLQGSGVSAYCFHPGLVASGFNRNNGMLTGLAMVAIKPFSRSTERGARTLVWLADTPEIDGDGVYFVDEKLGRPTRAAQDMEAAARLWDLSEQQTGLGQPAAF